MKKRDATNTKFNGSSSPLDQINSDILKSNKDTIKSILEDQKLTTLATIAYNSCFAYNIQSSVKEALCLLAHTLQNMQLVITIKQ